MIRQNGFDFTELDPVPVYFDLVIKSSQESDGSILAKAGEITRAVKPCRRRAAKWIRDKSLACPFWTVAIAARQAVAADMEFTCDAYGHGFEVLIQDIYPGIGYRASDVRQAYLSCLANGRRDGAEGRDHRAFGRSIMVDERAGKRGRRRAPQPIPPSEEGAKRKLLRPCFVEHQFRQGRGDEAERDFLFGQPAYQGGGRGARCIVHDMQAGAGGKAGPDLPHRSVECLAGDLRHAVLRHHRIVGNMPIGEIGQTAVSNLDPLGHACRSRGINDIGEIFRHNPA